MDTSRIVRADYSNPIYTRLAAKAIHHWRHSEWGQNGRYAQTGLMLVYPRDDSNARTYAIKSYDNIKALNDDDSKLAEYLPTKTDVLRAAPAFGKDMDVAGGYVNWGSGWSDAEASVRYAKERLLREYGDRVNLRVAQVDRLVYSEDGTKVTGVHLVGGERLNAELVVLATGAWTAQLMDLRGRTVSTGQALAYVRISDEEQARLENMPTVLNFATGMFVIPPRYNLLKIARHGYGYHNPVTVPYPHPSPQGQGQGQGESMSVSLPKNGVPVPREGQEDLRRGLAEFLPELADRPFVKTRVCWYTDTYVLPFLCFVISTVYVGANSTRPEGNFIVAPHPAHKGLFLATGGSGHAYKFFPVLGDKVVDALEGRLDPELQQAWAWPEPLVGEFGTEDGSRSGEKGVLLESGEEIVKSKL